MSNQNLARRAAVEIAFAGVDITKSIRPYLESLTYTDNEADKADDLQIQLQDRDSIWMEKWLVEAIEAASAAKLNMDAVILRENWLGDGKDAVLPCGDFELDNVVLSGPPAIITIKGTSLPFSAPVRQTKKNKAWENTTLSAIANEKAGANGMTCMYESAYDPFYKRVEQVDASDIDFLSRLCHDAGISLKATSSILVFFDQVAYEAKSSVITIQKGKTGGYIKYKLSVGAADSQYSSCRVSYVDPATGKCIEATAKIEDYNADAKNNQQLEVTAKVSSKDEAKTLAEKHLRLHNKYSKSATFTLPGNPALVAGVTVELKGWGAFDGKYIITQAVHTVGKSGYTTQIKLRRVLEGY
ncbi:contractile injection system protein, VgrG/Pvc8 family [Oscillospiraceae bacterium 44-5]